MDRKFFKYEYGFVSIDDRYIYFSSTGNGSELKKLTEKNKAVENKRIWKGIKNVTYLAVFGIVIALVLQGQLSQGKIYLVFIGLVGLGGYQLYQYLRTEIGARFKIPRTKLIAVKMTDNQALLTFINADNEEDEYKIQGIKDKGRQLLTDHFDVVVGDKTKL